MMMDHYFVLFLVLALYCIETRALSVESRRSFVSKAVMAGVGTTTVVVGSSSNQAAMAFYERDVGGSNPSAETAAYNIQVG